MYFEPTNTVEKGRKSEEVASGYLLKNGYKVLYRNWTCYAGEIDIVAFTDHLVFVEVKSVYSSDLIYPSELFTLRKRRKLTRSILYYIQKNDVRSCDWQLDLICIKRKFNGYSLRHFKNVTELPLL